MNTEFDLKRVEELKNLFGDDFPQQFNSFVTNTNKYLEGLERSIKENNREDANEYLHKMVSSTGQYGLLSVSKLAKELEYSNDTNFSENAPGAIVKMREQFESFKEILK